MENNSRLYVDVHILQTVPPSCINRDDTGSPKTAVYGGVTRARISSQSWKRACRLMFMEMFQADRLGMRTKKIVGLVANEIQSLSDIDNPEELAQSVLKAAGLKIKSTEQGTDALFFISVAQAKALAHLAVNHPKEIIAEKIAKETKKKAQDALTNHPAIDVALFGRMVADDPSLNTDACAQVAHAISTHKVYNEYDYFTAVDDCSPDDNAGAGHIGTVEFNSSTLYRYTTVAVHALNQHLGSDTAEAISNYVHAFACSMPTGKQNTFANRTLPDLVLVNIRQDQPINLVGAFERPIQPSDNGYVKASVQRLADHEKGVYRDFAQMPVLTLSSGQADGKWDTMPFGTLLETLASELKTRLQNGGNIQ